jgi:hypothetical protein
MRLLRDVTDYMITVRNEDGEQELIIFNILKKTAEYQIGFTT